MTAQEILEIVENGEYRYYGLRHDRNGLTAGFEFDNSKQWFADWQADWGDEPSYDDPEHPYNDDLGCWADGELSGVCTLGLSAYPTEAEIQATIDNMVAYEYSGAALYLVGGDTAETGFDGGELIISGGIVAAIISDRAA
ncbi:MAG: hypothetical protein J6X53_04860 [Abditibacteriota bacterium]|nr:hypothetical protein [Abditibacteriota bacterium]